MKTIIKEYTPKMDILKFIPDKNLLFFDIETTGLSADRDIIYLIGCIHYNGTAWQMIQFFCEYGGYDEKKLLLAFFKLCESKTTLVHFNGDSFDIRYVLRRAEILDIKNNIKTMYSIDFYRLLKKYKNIFQLENCKLKTLEQFLGIFREDKFNGKELISFYMQYLNNNSQNLERFILLHNEEDLYGLVDIIKIKSYIDYLDCLKNNTLNLKLCKYNENYEKNILNILVIPSISVPLDLSLAYKSWKCTFNKKDNSIFFQVKITYGMFYYYFENYKDYYYSTVLDEALHKSIAQFMNKDSLTKANSKNCYTKKEGYFIETFSKECFDCFNDNLNKKDIYIPLNINEHKYLSEINVCTLINSFFKTVL